MARPLVPVMTRYNIALIVATVALIGAAIFVGDSFKDDPPPDTEKPVAMSPVLQSAIVRQQAERISKIRGDGPPRWNQCFIFEQGRQNCVPTITVDDAGVTHDPILPCEVRIERACKEKYGWAQ